MLNPVRSALRATAERSVALVAACNRMRLPGTQNPFVVGVHAPMREELTLRDLPVTGSIPAGLDGRYLKMGANPARPVSRGHDWFLGDGMVHGLAIEDGRALWYRNRWIGSRTAAAALRRAPAPGPRRGNDTVNTNVVEIGGRAFALVEAGSFPVELSPTLEAQRYSSFAPRKQLDAALEFARSGDTLVVTKLDRLARSVVHMGSIIATLEAKGVALRIVSLGVDTATPTGRLMLNVLGGVAQFGREMMLERQREGIAKAKLEGAYKGRKPTARAKTAEVKALAAEGLSMGAIAAKLGIGKGSVHRALSAKPEPVGAA